MRRCRIANRDHAKQERFYAHTFHYPNTICVADAFDALPDGYKLAIYMHEIGHLLAGPKGSEAAANAAIENATGIKIFYKDSAYGKRLEWLTPSDQRRAITAMGMKLA